jgi:predicted Na+-dependent transporter
LLNLLGASLSPSEEAYCEALVNRFSGMFFILWVLLPTAAGFAVRLVLTSERIADVSHWWMLASAAALLGLNYINSAVALPHLSGISISLFATTIALAAALSAVGLLTGWFISRLMKLGESTRFALLFGLSMKHTGLALLLAGAVLVNQPTAILLIVLATLMQHVVAAAVQWFLHPAVS